MKNLYEILEIDKNASDEIIKVAHKSLVKKYHPDLKEGQEKTNAEEKIKEINDAYDVLSDHTKRAEYDQTLLNENISAEKYNLILKENTRLKMQLNYLQNSYNKTKIYGYSNNYSNNSNNQEINYNENNNNTEKGFKTYIYNLDNSIKNIIAILLTFLIIFIVFKIPFLRDFIINLFSQGFFIIIIIIFAFFYFFRNRKD